MHQTLSKALHEPHLLNPVRTSQQGAPVRTYMVVTRIDTVGVLVVLFTTPHPGEGEAGSTPSGKSLHQSVPNNRSGRASTGLLQHCGAIAGSVPGLGERQ